MSPLDHLKVYGGVPPVIVVVVVVVVVMLPLDVGVILVTFPLIRISSTVALTVKLSPLTHPISSVTSIL